MYCIVSHDTLRPETMSRVNGPLPGSLALPEELFLSELKLGQGVHDLRRAIPDAALGGAHPGCQAWEKIIKGLRPVFNLAPMGEL
jgi:hypothetical protein